MAARRGTPLCLLHAQQLDGAHPPTTFGGSRPAPPPPRRLADRFSSAPTV
jgi:hypothetical protein